MINSEVLKNHYFLYSARPGFPHVIYKRWFDGDSTLPRFVWVKPDGDWWARNTKHTIGDDGNPLPVLAAGKMNP